MSEILFLSNVRLSFPHLVEPQRTVSEATGKERIAYNADFIVQPTNPGWASFMKSYQTLAATKWKEVAGNVMQMINNDRRLRCFGAGNEKLSKDFKIYDGYEGNMYISASRDIPPQIIQGDGTAIDPNNSMAYQQLTRKMYGGCKVNAAIKPWPQDNKYGRAIRCELVAIQFAGDDTPFGEGAVDATPLFGAVAGAAPGMFGAVAPAMPAAPFGMPSFLMGQ